VPAITIACWQADVVEVPERTICEVSEACLPHEAALAWGASSPGGLMHTWFRKVLPLLLAAGLATPACGGGGDDRDAAVKADCEVAGIENRGQPPVIESVMITQNPDCVLSAILDVRTDVPASFSLRIEGDGHGRTIRFEERGTDLALPILGLRAETAYSFTVTAAAEDGTSATHGPVSYVTAALPDGPFPPLEVTIRNEAKMVPGVTVFSSMILQLPLDQRPGLFLAVDAEGEVIWYHTHPDQVLESFRLTEAGTLLYLAGTDGAREMDMLGKTLREWSPQGREMPAGIEVLGVHHDIIELPGGNVAAIGIEMRDIEHVVEGKAVIHHVMGDVILEWTRDGALVHAWSAFDFLDPQFYKQDFFDNFWDLYVDVKGGTKNWTHGNALIHDATDDSFILSLRHLDWLVKVSRQTGKLAWKMGEFGDFALADGSEWFYHAHSAELLEPGRIMLFDNGNLRPGYTAETFFSRALELTFDETSMVCAEAWEWRDSEPFYSQYLGDADRLPGGNVLVGDGGRVQDQAQPLYNPFNLKWYRIVEVTGDGEVVWELRARDFSGNVLGYSLYRAQRWPSIYPAAVAQEVP